MEKVRRFLSHSELSFQRHVTMRVAGLLLLNMSPQFLLLGVLILLTRLMTPGDFGSYVFLFALMMLLAVPFTSSAIPVKHYISDYAAEYNWGRMKGFLTVSFSYVMTGAFLLAAICLPFSNLIEKDSQEAYRIGLLILPFSGLLLYAGAILRGLKCVALGWFSDFLIQPGLMFSILLALWAAGTFQTNIPQAMHIYVVTLGMAMFSAAAFAASKLPAEVLKTPASYDLRTWLRRTPPLMITGGLVVFNSYIGVVMMGAMAGEDQAGAYFLALQLAAFILLFPAGAYNALGPTIVSLYQQGAFEKLQSLLTSAARTTFALAVPVAVLIIFFPFFMVNLLFDETYTGAAMALIALGATGLFNTAMGPAGQIMSLAGHEKYNALAASAAAAVHVLFNGLMIPLFGIEGAAVAYGLSTLIWNGLLAYWVLQKTGLSCSIFGQTRKSMAGEF